MFSKTVHRSARGSYLVLLVLTAGIGLGLLAAATVMAGSRVPTKGPIPPAAFQAGDPIDFSMVPDFIPALGQSGDIVGYVSKGSLITQGGSGFSADRPIAADVPVYADDLKTLVGHMVPGRGFVPIGVDKQSVPLIPFEVAPADKQVAP
jgi:hypothetical protein